MNVVTYLRPTKDCGNGEVLQPVGAGHSCWESAIDSGSENILRAIVKRIRSLTARAAYIPKGQKLL